MIAKDALVYAQQGKRKTLQRKDLGKKKTKLKDQYFTVQLNDSNLDVAISIRTVLITIKGI